MYEVYFSDGNEKEVRTFAYFEHAEWFFETVRGMGYNSVMSKAVV